MREHRLDRPPARSTVEVAAWLPGSVSAWRRRVVVGAAVLALLPTLARVLVNAPVTVPLDLAGAAEPLSTLGLLAVAVAALVLGTTERDLRAGIGLLFVGVFGLLVALAPDAVVAAAVAMPAGAGLVVLHDRLTAGASEADGTGASEADDPGARGPTRTQAAVAGLLLGGAFVSVAGALGIYAGSLRPAGSALALLGAGTTPVFFRTTSSDWVVGGVAAAGVLTVAAAAPFVLGAVLLVGLGVVGTPLLVVAAGLGGLAVAGSAAFRSGTWLGLAAVALLVAGGAPASAGSVLAVCLAAVILAGAGLAPQAAPPGTPSPSAAPGGEPT